MTKLIVLVCLIVTAKLAISAQAAGNGGVEQQLGVAEASNEGQLALKQFVVAPGITISLFAAEPMLANPLTFTTDGQGRWYVAKTFRVYTGVPDEINAHYGYRDGGP